MTRRRWAKKGAASQACLISPRVALRPSRTEMLSSAMAGSPIFRFSSANVSERVNSSSPWNR